MDKFLNEHKYIDFSTQIIVDIAQELFSGLSNYIDKARTAYVFVRDEIPHTFDIQSEIITAKASDVLKYKTGICYAKANLLAALLRSQRIPIGFCYQHLTLADDDSLGYVVHCYNAIYIAGRWIKVDARGNKPGVNAQFSINEPVLAFPCRPEYDEYFWRGIYAAPHGMTMKMLDKSRGLQELFDNMPDMIAESPDIEEE